MVGLADRHEIWPDSIHPFINRGHVAPFGIELRRQIFIAPEDLARKRAHRVEQMNKIQMGDCHGPSNSVLVAKLKILIHKRFVHSNTDSLLVDLPAVW